MKDLLADIADRCRNVRWQGADRFTSSCPNYQAHEHGDKNRSFSARATPTRILLKCHKGCSLEAICSALQIRQSYLFRDQEKRLARTAAKPAPVVKPEDRQPPAIAKRVSVLYDYVDVAGKLLFQTVRYDPKDFRQRRPDNNGGWIWNLEGVKPILFNLPQVHEANTVYIVEGEKDVLTMRDKFGLVATCNPMGARKWRAEFNEELSGKRAIIIRDNDEVGMAHELEIASGLKSWARPLCVCRLPEKIKDVSDWPFSKEAFLDYLRTATIPWDEAQGLIAQSLQFPDMPAEVLDGRLGEWSERRLGDLPRAYAWPALVGVASIFLEEQPERTNLYTALVGPVGSGKTQAIERAIRIFGATEPQVLETFAGSAEQLISRIGDLGGARRLFAPDELAHVFKKAQIDRASFPFFLNRAYYSDRVELLALKKRVTFHCRLTVLGGMIGDLFDNCFGFESVGGSWDRFFFGYVELHSKFQYRPFEGGQEHFLVRPVIVDGSVWDARTEYVRAHPLMNRRVLETAVNRYALIAAAFDGRGQLRGQDLAPAFALAEYQMLVRQFLKPNTGETTEGRVAAKILAYLDRQMGFVPWRELRRQTHLYDLGPVVTDRVMSVLRANGDVEMTKIGKQMVVRRRLTDEDEDANASSS